MPDRSSKSGACVHLPVFSDKQLLLFSTSNIGRYLTNIFELINAQGACGDTDISDPPPFPAFAKSLQRTPPYGVLHERPVKVFRYHPPSWKGSISCGRGYFSLTFGLGVHVVEPLVEGVFTGVKILTNRVSSHVPLALA